jgi:Glycosyl transferase family 2
VSLDIVVPAYNEEHRIDRMLQAYRASFTGGDVRFLTALDRCSDGTADVVRRHAAEDSRVELHEYPKLGKGGVIMETFRRCAADFLAFVDADCATPRVSCSGWSRPRAMRTVPATISAVTPSATPTPRIRAGTRVPAWCARWSSWAPPRRPVPSRPLPASRPGPGT